MLLKVESVANDKHIGELKSSVANGYIDDSRDDPVEQGADLKASRVACLEESHEVAQRQPCRHDIFDNDHLFAFNTFVQVFQYSHNP